MVKETRSSELRRHLGIKRLRKEIVITEAEKIAIKKKTKRDEKKRISHTAASLEA